MVHIGSIIGFRPHSHARLQIVIDSGFPNVCDMCSVSIAKNIVHPQTANDCGYLPFGELAHFTYCFIQKTK